MISRRKSDPILALFFVSGFAGLIYEAIWTHYVKLFLGHAAYAQTLVLVVFIGGLALGAWLCARVAQRLRNPLRLYAIVEGAIGLVSLVFHPIFVATTDWGYASLLPATCEQASAFCAPQWLLSALLLAPQSILLGATFPLVSSAVLRLDSSQPGHDVAALYFLNSLGAVVGVLAATFLLLPALGLPGTLRTAGLVNLVLALAAFLLSRTAPPPLAVERVAPAAAEAEAPGGDRRLLQLLLATAFLTGLSSFIYEIGWIRMLSLVLGASTHSFELMLASFILGLALGGAWVRNRVDRVGNSLRFLALVQLAMGVAAAATLPVYNATFDVMAWILSSLARNTGGFLLFSLASSGIALLVMLPATFCAGMTLPLITYRLLRSPSGEKALGLVYAVNTLGSIIGVVIAVHLLLEAVGVRGAILVGALIDVALGVMLLASLRPAGAPLRFPASAVAAIAALAAIAVAFDIDVRRSSSGVFRTGMATIAKESHVIYHRDGKTATVDVLDNEGMRSIRTNGKPDASLLMNAQRAHTGDEYTQTLMAVLPLGHHPQATRAAVVGLGSGMTSALLLASPRLERVDTIEIEPAMYEGAKLFRPHVSAAYDDPRSRIIIDDAKSFFARGRERYDIIVSEPSNPWVSGVASLFTQEFYARLAGYMNDHGLLVQWLHTYELDTPTFAAILGAVSRTFPDYSIYSSIDSDVILVARKGGNLGAFDRSVLQLEALQPILLRLQLADPRLIERRLMGTSRALAPLFRTYGMPANSDYFPVVDQRASKTRFTYDRVNEITDLQAAPVPMLEMLGGAPTPRSERLETLRVTYVETATARAWTLHDILVPGSGERPKGPLIDAREIAAQLTRSWTTCRSELAFEQILPSLVAVAETVNPRLNPQVASQLWRRISGSVCAWGLDGNERRWLQLFEAVARRDAETMLATAKPLLEHTRGETTSATEYAFMSAATAMLCRGDYDGAHSLLEKGHYWVRAGTRLVELRFLESMLIAGRANPRAAASCAAR